MIRNNNRCIWVHPMIIITLQKNLIFKIQAEIIERFLKSGGDNEHRRCNRGCTITEKFPDTRVQHARHAARARARSARDHASPTSHAGESRKRTESLSRQGCGGLSCRSYKLPHSDRNRAVWPDYLVLSLSLFLSFPLPPLSRESRARLRPGSRNANWPITGAPCTPSTPCTTVYLVFWISQFTDRNARLTPEELRRKVSEDFEKSSIFCYIARLRAYKYWNITFICNYNWIMRKT